MLDPVASQKSLLPTQWLLSTPAQLLPWSSFSLLRVALLSALHNKHSGDNQLRQTSTHENIRDRARNSAHRKPRVWHRTSYLVLQVSFPLLQIAFASRASATAESAQ